MEQQGMVRGGEGERWGNMYLTILKIGIFSYFTKYEYLILYITYMHCHLKSISLIYFWKKEHLNISKIGGGGRAE